METVSEQHRYPSRYPKGCHWAIDDAWEILDMLPVGMLPDDYRFLLAGYIAGRLMRRASDAAKRARANGRRT